MNLVVFHSLRRRFARVGRSAFSLVEVTIATGIASFGIIALLALLPSGLNMFRDAMNVTVSSQIAQRLIKEAVQTDYETLLEIAVGAPPPTGPVVKPVRYFTDEGVELPASKASEAIFHVHTRLMAITNLPTAGGTFANDSLATITVQVALNPGNKTLPVLGNGGGQNAGLIDPASNISYITYSSHIAKVK